jgi:hypothetical protein
VVVRSPVHLSQRQQRIACVLFRCVLADTSPQLRDMTIQEVATIAALARDLDLPPPDAAQILTGMPTARSATSGEGAQAANTDAIAIARSVLPRAAGEAAHTHLLHGARAVQVESVTEVIEHDHRRPIWSR